MKSVLLSMFFFHAHGIWSNLQPPASLHIPLNPVSPVSTSFESMHALFSITFHMSVGWFSASGTERWNMVMVRNMCLMLRLKLAALWPFTSTTRPLTNWIFYLLVSAEMTNLWSRAKMQKHSIVVRFIATKPTVSHRLEMNWGVEVGRCFFFLSLSLFSTSYAPACVAIRLNTLTTAWQQKYAVVFLYIIILNMGYFNSKDHG